MPEMLMIAPAPVIETGGKLRLDGKFVEGTRDQQAHWPGRITVALHRGTPAIPSGREHDRSELPFDLVLLDPGQSLTAADLDGSASSKLEESSYVP
jgi:hypothetical protein